MKIIYKKLAYFRKLSYLCTVRDEDTEACFKGPLQRKFGLLFTKKNTINFNLKKLRQ